MSAIKRREKTVALDFILITYFLFVLLIFEFVFDTDPDDVYKQFAQLRRIGGDTVKETVKLLMNRLMNNYAMSFISLDGRSYVPNCCR